MGPLKLLPSPARHQFSPIGTDLSAPGPTTPGLFSIVLPKTFSLPDALVEAGAAVGAGGRVADVPKRWSARRVPFQFTPPFLMSTSVEIWSFLKSVNVLRMPEIQSGFGSPSTRFAGS